MARQAADSTRLHDILGAFHAGATTRAETHAGVLDLILERIGCTRVTMWRFDEHDGELTLLRFASKTAGAPLDTGEQRLRPRDYDAYYAALAERGVHASSDALADPLLAPLRTPYLVPGGIVALLDAAFVVNSHAYGRVCCEETAQRRSWPQADVVALRAIVNRIALLMWSAPLQVLHSSPSLSLRAAPPPPASMAPQRRRI